MKIRVAVNNVTIDKKHPKKCGRNCPGLYFDPVEGYMCTVFSWVTIKATDGLPDRCRACVLNQLPPKGVKRCR